MTKKIDQRNNIKVVIQNDFIKARPSQNMEANAQKLLRMAIAQSKMTDKEFYEYEISAMELAQLFNVTPKNIYMHIDRWTSQCMGTVLEFRNSESEKFRKYALFGRCEYENGVLRMKLNEDMTPFVLGIKQKLGFTQYELANVLTLKGKYSIRIYEMIMCQIKNKLPYAEKTAEIELEIAEIRKQTSTENRYKKVIDLKKNVVFKALEEIEKNMNWKIETIEVKKGRTIYAFKLRIWSEVGFNYVSKTSDYEQLKLF